MPTRSRPSNRLRMWIFFIFGIYFHHVTSSRNHRRGLVWSISPYLLWATHVGQNVNGNSRILKMEGLYHTRQYFGGISPYIALTRVLYMVRTSNLGSWNGHWKYLWRKDEQQTWETIRKQPSVGSPKKSCWLTDYLYIYIYTHMYIFIIICHGWVMEFHSMRADDIMYTA